MGLDIEQRPLRVAKDLEFKQLLEQSHSDLNRLKSTVEQVVEMRQEVIDNDLGLFEPEDGPKTTALLLAFKALIIAWYDDLPGG